MIIPDRQDALLTATVETVPSATVPSEHAINIAEPGGVEGAQLILTAPAVPGGVKIDVLGSDSADGEFKPVEGLSYTTTADQAFEKRVRIPLHAPQFLKLQVETPSSGKKGALVTMRVAI